MRTGFLRGRDHTLLGGVAALAEHRIAIALSRGGAPKTYRYREVNEDAAAFAYGEHAWLVAVADGHWGAGGAILALERILEHHAPRWSGPHAPDLEARWRDEAAGVATDLNLALCEQRVGRTTLALCLVRPAERWLLGLTVGDSHVFRIEPSAARELCARAPRDNPVFLGDTELEPAQLLAGCRASSEIVTGGGAVLLATDGLSEPGIGVDDPLHAAAEAERAARATPPGQRPLAAVRGVVEAALAAQRRQRAGDNVASACIALDSVG